MELILKNYKLAKIKSLVKTQKIIFLFHFTNDNNKKWIKLEQDMFNKKLKYYKIDSSLVNFLFKNSIYLNLNSLIYGPIVFIYLSKFFLFNYFLHKIYKLNNKLHLFCFILNKKLYSINSILNIKTFKFLNNINNLFIFFKHFISIIFLSSLLLLNKKLISK